MSNDAKYVELARARVQENKDLVISSFSKGGYTIVQQVEFDEDGYKMRVPLKGAFHIKESEGLYNLRDALNVAIKIIEEEKQNSSKIC